MQERTPRTPVRTFLFLLFLLTVATCSACAESSSSPQHARVSPTARNAREPTRVSLVPSPSPAPQVTGTVYVATQPSVGAGGILTALLAQSGEQLWSFQTAVTYLSVTLANGAVYVAGSQLSAAGQSRVYALNARDGSPVWSTQLPVPGLSAPLFDSGTVYVTSPSDGTVYALRSTDGSLLWYAKTVKGAGSSPLLVGRGTLYVGSHDSGTVFALRSSDGQVMWSGQSGQQGITNLTLSGDVLYFLGVSLNGTMPGVVHAVRVRDGSDLWHDTVGNAANLSLALWQDSLYLSNAAGGELQALRARDGSQLWRGNLIGAESGIAAFQVVRGVVYAVANRSGEVFAVRAGDGILLWKYRDLQVASLWGLTFDGEMVYLVGDNVDAAHIYVLDVRDGSLLWRSSQPTGGDLPLTVSITPGAVVVAHANTGRISRLTPRGKDRWSFELKCPDPVAPFPVVVSQ